MNPDFESRLREAARSLPVPDAPATLIDRVIAERATGARFDLLAGSASRRAIPRWIAVTAVAAAVVLAILLLPGTTHRNPPLSDFSSTGLFIGTAFAEQSPSGPDAPPLVDPGSPTLGPRRYDYSITYSDSRGRVTSDGGGSVNVSPLTVGGVSAWRIDLSAQQTIDGQRRAASETLVVAQRGLRPISRVVHVRPYLRYSSIDIRQSFNADSVHVDMRTDGGIHRVAAQRLPRQYGPFISDAIAPLALVGQRLDAESRFSVSLLGWAVIARDVFYPVTLRVVGDERITTPSGVFDCWKIDVSAGRDHRVEWIRKSDGLALRSIDTRPTPRGTRRFELLNP